MLEAYDAATEPSAKAALLGREGLYSSHVVDWRRARDAAALAGLTPAPRPRHSPEQLELEQLRRANARLSRELAKTRAALDVVGKAHALLELLSEARSAASRTWTRRWSTCRRTSSPTTRTDLC